MARPIRSRTRRTRAVFVFPHEVHSVSRDDLYVFAFVGATLAPRS
jgi:hypothetical protein